METVTPWRPFDGTDAELFLDAVSQGRDQALVLTFSAGRTVPRLLQVRFEFVKAFRVSPQHIHSRAVWWGQAGAGSMFEVADSSYLASLADASPSDFNGVGYKHFMFITADGCVDAVSVDAPIASWTSNPSFQRTAFGGR